MGYWEYNGLPNKFNVLAEQMRALCRLASCAYAPPSQRGRLFWAYFPYRVAYFGLVFSDNGRFDLKKMATLQLHYVSYSCQVRTLGFFFCKVAGKNPWSRVAVFWGLFKKGGCLLGESDKQLCFFIYVRRILQCIDWHSVCWQSIDNQWNISAVA